MWFQRRFPARTQRPLSPFSIFIYREFQLRYISFLLTAVLAAMVVAGGPSYYFLNQNYEIFMSLAYDRAPQLLQHLERERVWINGFLISALVGVILFCIVFGLRLTSRIAKPVFQLEQHMRLLSRGHWYIPEIQIDQNSEFFELIDTYNYFYKSLQITTREQIKQMGRLKIGQNHHDSAAILKDLMSLKSQQVETQISVEASQAS